jgi:hypothetical protein
MHIVTIQPSTLTTTLIFDVFSVCLMLILPAISHLIGIPLYLMEPMRVILVLALILTSRYNTYLIAAILPLLSYLVSGHPFPAKMLIITMELLLNTWLFIFFCSKSGKPFISMLSSIIFSKVFCYMMYWIFFSWIFVEQESRIIFLLIQVGLTLLLSSMTYVISRNHQIISVHKKIK